MNERRKLIISLNQDKLVDLAEEGLLSLTRSMENILSDIKRYNYITEGDRIVSALKKSYNIIKRKMEYFDVPTKEFDKKFEEIIKTK